MKWTSQSVVYTYLTNSVHYNISPKHFIFQYITQNKWELGL